LILSFWSMRVTWFCFFCHIFGEEKYWDYSNNLAEDSVFLEKGPILINTHMHC
jgi:hypothetical protein